MLIHDPIDGWTVVASGRPDMDTVRHYMRRERRTYIAQLEGLGRLAPYYTFPRRFAGRRVVHFADNAVAISAHGHSASVDMADIPTHTTCLRPATTCLRPAYARLPTLTTCLPRPT